MLFACNRFGLHGFDYPHGHEQIRPVRVEVWKSDTWRRFERVEPSSDIAALFRQLLEALVTDVDAYASGFSDDPDVRVILTAEDEWIKGPSDLRSIARRRIQEIGLRSVDILRLEAFQHGESGWAAADLVVYGDGGPVGLRVTAVFVEETDWRVVQWHASSGVPNAQAWGVELTKSLDELVTDLDTNDREALEDVAPDGRVSFLFSDIVGSTRVASLVGDAAWAGVLAEHFAATRKVVLDNGGRLIKTLGDGAMAAFASAARAVRAGVRMQAMSVDSDFGIRVGIHTGPALRMGGDYYGSAVNKAARVASAAGPGDVFVSDETAELITTSIAVVDRGSFELEGLPGTHRLYSVDTG